MRNYLKIAFVFISSLLMISSVAVCTFAESDYVGTTMHGLQLMLNDQLQEGEVNSTNYNSLSRNLNRVQERLQNMTNIRVYEDDEGLVMIQSQKEAKLFGIFRLQKTFNYEYLENGELKYQYKWYDFMWKQEE